MLEYFFAKPFLALILMSLSCSLLGVFVLWKKLAYFGDALSHAILLGFIGGAIFSLNNVSILIIFAIIFALLVGLSFNDRYFSKDTIIAISSYFCFALAGILKDLWFKDFDFESYIFGDISTVGNTEIQVLALVGIFTILFTIFAFKKILFANINSDLARIDGVKTDFWNLFFLVLLSLVIALSVKIVGIFLMTALLILPAAIARIFSTSPKQMIIFSLIINLVATTLSSAVSQHYNLTISSLLILTLVLIFFGSIITKKY